LLQGIAGGNVVEISDTRPLGERFAITKAVVLSEGLRRGQQNEIQAAQPTLSNVADWYGKS